MRVPIFQINEVLSELYNCRMADMPASGTSNKHIRTCNVFGGFYMFMWLLLIVPVFVVCFLVFCRLLLVIPIHLTLR